MKECTHQILFGDETNVMKNQTNDKQEDRNKNLVEGFTNGLITSK